MIHELDCSFGIHAQKETGGQRGEDAKKSTDTSILSSTARDLAGELSETVGSHALILLTLPRRTVPTKQAAPLSYSEPGKPWLPVKTRTEGLFISSLSTPQHLSLCLPLTEFRHFRVAPEHKKAHREHSEPYGLPAFS